MPLLPDWLMEAIDRLQGRTTVEPLQMVTDPRDRYEAINRMRAADRYRRGQSDTLGMSDPEYVSPVERLLGPSGDIIRQALEESASSGRGAVSRAAAAAPSLDEADREDAAEKQRLIEEANKPKMETKQSDWVQAEWSPEIQQRKFMEGTVPLIEDYDKRIAIGGDPKRGTAEEILMKIRAEASAKGRRGSLRGGIVTADDLRAAANPRGGGFSTAKDSPELRQRQADLDAWLEDAPIRSAEYAMSPEMSRRDPAGADRGAKVLTDLRSQKILRDQQGMQQKIVDSLGDGAGKIPFEKANQLEMLGFQVPHQVRGMSKDQAISLIDAQIGGLQKELVSTMSKAETGMIGQSEQVQLTFGYQALQKLQTYKGLIESGQMTPDEAEAEIRRVIAEPANELQRYLNYSMRGQQPVAPVGE